MNETPRQRNARTLGVRKVDDRSDRIIRRLREYIYRGKDPSQPAPPSTTAPSVYSVLVGERPRRRKKSQGDELDGATSTPFGDERTRSQGTLAVSTYYRMCHEPNSDWKNWKWVLDEWLAVKDPRTWQQLQDIRAGQWDLTHIFDSVVAEFWARLPIYVPAAAPASDKRDLEDQVAALVPFAMNEPEEFLTRPAFGDVSPEKLGHITIADQFLYATSTLVLVMGESAPVEPDGPTWEKAARLAADGWDVALGAISAARLPEHTVFSQDHFARVWTYAAWRADADMSELRRKMPECGEIIEVAEIEAELDRLAVEDYDEQQTKDAVSDLEATTAELQRWQYLDTGALDGAHLLRLAHVDAVADADPAGRRIDRFDWSAFSLAEPDAFASALLTEDIFRPVLERVCLFWLNSDDWEELMVGLRTLARLAEVAVKQNSTQSRAGFTDAGISPPSVKALIQMGHLLDAEGQLKLGDALPALLERIRVLADDPLWSRQPRRERRQWETIITTHAASLRTRAQVRPIKEAVEKLKAEFQEGLLMDRSDVDDLGKAAEDMFKLLLQAAQAEILTIKDLRGASDVAVLLPPTEILEQPPTRELAEPVVRLIELVEKSDPRQQQPSSGNLNSGTAATPTYGVPATDPWHAGSTSTGW